MEEYDFRILNENSLMYFRESINVIEKEIYPKWSESKEDFDKNNIEITKNLSNLQIIVEYDSIPTQDIKQTISTLYHDDLQLKKMLKNNHKYSIGDPVNYIFSNVENYFNDEYLFTEKDLLKSYKKSTGVSKFEFTYNNQNFCIYDTGGQRNERLKWKLILEQANAIIYVGALSQYNERCYEDDETNKMLECLNLLKSVVDDENISDLPFYLYLNKRDILVEQLQIEDISIAFPNCPKELKFKENNLLKFSSPIERSLRKTKRSTSRVESWQETKKVGKTSRIVELSQDELYVIFSYLRAKELTKLSLVYTEFYFASNSDGLWKQQCLNYDSNLKSKKIQDFYDPTSNFSPWKYYYIKSKEFFSKSENYLIDEFLEFSRHHPREIYITSAIDNSIRKIFLETLDDLISLKKDEENQFIIPMDFGTKK